MRRLKRFFEGKCSLTLLAAVFATSILLSCASPAAPVESSGDFATSVDVISSTPAATPTPDRAQLTFDGDSALDYAAAQMAFGPRPTGSEASQQTAEYILSTLAAFGWETETIPFIYQGVEGQNLVARMGTSDGPIYMFGAHYDTRFVADQDAERPDAPLPGANDGASGVAVLLELARSVDLSGVEGDVWLVFFDAEDNGRLEDWEYIAGSRIFVEEMEIEPVYFVLVDMVGDADQQLYLEQNSDPILRDHLWLIGEELGYDDSFIAEPGYSMIDDHTPFLERGIPAVDIIDFDYPYWHTTDDTIDKLSADSLERVGRVLEVFLERGGAYPGN